jgi:hypothetical protein
MLLLIGLPRIGQQRPARAWPFNGWTVSTKRAVDELKRELREYKKKAKTQAPLQW